MSYSHDEIERSLRLFRVFSRAYRNVAEHSIRDSKSHGLNPTEFAILEQLYHKGSMPLQQIGSPLLMVSAKLTYAVDKLEAGGYLQRQPSTEDRRVIFAVLTEKGQQFMDHMFPSHAAVIADSLSGLTAEEQEQVTELLKKMGIEAERKLKEKERPM